MWFLLALSSSLCLSIYDLYKKKALQDIPVLGLLTWATCLQALVFLPSLFFSNLFPGQSPDWLPKAPIESLRVVGLLTLKAVLVGSSWFFAYVALKKLPLSTVAPIRSTAPAWTLLGAFFLFGEVWNGGQFTGLIVTIISVFLFSLAGKKEGIHFRNNIFIYSIVLATLLGSLSALYDKYLLQTIHRITVQATFINLMSLMLIPIWIIHQKSRKKSLTIPWRQAAPVALFLLIADLLYFKSLSIDGVYISLVSAIRRSSVVFTFILAGKVFKEKNLKHKALPMVGIIMGILFIALFSL